jgi:hypothetical protein
MGLVSFVGMHKCGIEKKEISETLYVLFFSALRWVWY